MPQSRRSSTRPTTLLLRLPLQQEVDVGGDGVEDEGGDGDEAGLSRRRECLDLLPYVFWPLSRLGARPLAHVP